MLEFGEDNWEQSFEQNHVYGLIVQFVVAVIIFSDQFDLFCADSSIFMTFIVFDNIGFVMFY